MITADKLGEAHDALLQKYQESLSEFALNNLDSTVHSFCKKYGLTFLAGNGMWTWTTNGLCPHNDYDYWMGMLEETTSECLEEKEEALDSIQSIISESINISNTKELKECLVEGRRIGQILDVMADRVSCWGEYVSCYFYERFPQHIK